MSLSTELFAVVDVLKAELETLKSESSAAIAAKEADIGSAIARAESWLAEEAKSIETAVEEFLGVDPGPVVEPAPVEAAPVEPAPADPVI